jgi:hypothetical protein
MRRERSRRPLGALDGGGSGWQSGRQKMLT